MAGFNAGKLTFTITCPICGSTIQSSLGAAEAGRTVVCPQGHRIDLEPDSSVSQVRRDLDRSFRKLDQSLNRFGRRR